MDHLKTAKRVLVVDDIFDSGDTVAAVKDAFSPFVSDLKFATLYYKPLRNKWPFGPDWWLRETDAWLVFPHELMGLTPEEVRRKDPEIYRTLLGGKGGESFSKE
jgi:hypoxanthine phosphoribosyltransferase